MKKTALLKIILCSVLMSVFYISSIFISDIISYKSMILSFIYLIVSVLMYWLMLVSESRKNVCIKWLFSIPLSFLLLQYFWKTHYSVRALNWVFSDYGIPSAGGKFTAAFTTVFFSVICLIGIVSAIFYRPKNHDLIERIQFSIGSLSGIIIVITVILLERQFPSYTYIFTYG